MRTRTSAAYATISLVLAASLFTSAAAFGAPSTATSATPTPAPVTRPAPTPSVIPAPVDPATAQFRAELQARQARLDAFKAQLDLLDQELAIAAEAYNGASVQLAATKEKLTVTKQDLSAAESALEVQRALLETRIQAMYRDGNHSDAELLLQSSSLPDFLTRLDFITTIGKSDADLATQLANQRDQIENQAADFQKAELSAEALEFDLKARQIEIQGRIADRQSLMASAQSDLLALLGTESARRQVDEASLLKEILAGAAQVGVTVTPGSPVETALAYHGIPYVWGGATPSGFDCSGLTMYVYAQHGVILPHHAADQYLMGTPVAANNLMPGDLVFFGRSSIYHVGMYIGGGYFVQAPRTGDFVKVTKLSDHGDYAGARRYDWRPRTAPVLGVSSITLPGNLPVH